MGAAAVLLSNGVATPARLRTHKHTRVAVKDRVRAGTTASASPSPSPGPASEPGESSWAASKSRESWPTKYAKLVAKRAATGLACLSLLSGSGDGFVQIGNTIAPRPSLASPRALAAPADLAKESGYSLSNDENQAVRLFQRATPSVVFVTNFGTQRDAYTLDVMEVPKGAGTGFIWDAGGHVVTNFHVIRGASDLKVTLSDQRTLDAKVVGFDEDKDVAVLQLVDKDGSPASNMEPIQVGKSRALFVGQSVYAIGNPFGLDHTMTSGIISGLGRVIMSQTGRPIRGAIQTDAAINPGNSGGPLMDRGGRLIGINTAILDPSGSGASAGVGFAIPIDTARGVVEQIIKYGRIVRPYLGITLAPDTAVNQLGIRGGGVLVLDVPKGSPALGKLEPTYRSRFGQLVLGDVIVAINGVGVKTSGDLYAVLDELRVGDEVDIKALRDNAREEVEVTIKLGERVTQFES